MGTPGSTILKTDRIPTIQTNAKAELGLGVLKWYSLKCFRVTVGPAKDLEQDARVRWERTEAGLKETSSDYAARQGWVCRSHRVGRPDTSWVPPLF